MRRACRLSLDCATASKRRQVASLLEAYRGAVNFYIRSLWHEPGRLDKATLARLPGTRLSARYKSQALKQALEIVGSTRKAAAATGVAASRPVFRGAAVLDAKFVAVEPGRGSFDLVVRLATLVPGRRIVLPTRRTAVLNKWAAQPLARIIQGCALSERGIVVWVELPDLPPREEGRVLGVDVGVAKLLATSDGEFYGADFRRVRDQVNRRRPGSAGKRRARIERDRYINRVAKQLPWPELRAIGFEDLNGLKAGKNPSRGKAFRKAVAPWLYRRVRQRLERLAQENRVLPVAVAPRGTSRTCPDCGTEDRRNRVGERFRCVACDRTGDADHIGGLNIRQRAIAALGSVASPGPPGLRR